MNSLNQTDLQDWELLHQDGGGNVTCSDNKLQHQEEPEKSVSVEINPPQASEEPETRVDRDSPFEYEEENEACDRSERDGGNLNIWKWSLTGMATICSFGVAAASICIIILTNHRKNNRSLQFHIYTNDKNHNSSKLDEAISTLRGGSIITRARLTFGGYYDAPL